MEVIIERAGWLIKIILEPMATAFDYYNPHSTDSQPEWDGLRSSKFARTKAFLPKRDSINLGIASLIM